MEPIRLGIDFGTTHSVVAACDRGNYPVISITDGRGDMHEQVPSAVAIRGDEWRFGADAVALADEEEWTLIRSFKRWLGDPGARLPGGRTPLEVTTRYLSWLRESLLARSNLPGARAGAILQVAVAAPANAHSTQRFLTLEAFRRAGFDVLAMHNEPSAAGFEYAHRHGRTITSKRDHIIVYDLGGGTFDVSLIRASGRHHEVIDTAGEGRLGGDDFDEILARLVWRALREPEPPAVAVSVLEACRVAKEALAPQSRRVTVVLPVLGEVTVPVADFYAACAPLVERTILAMEPVLRRADEDEAGGPSELRDVAGIYVVGGASSLPLVGRALRERFGHRVHRSPYPFAATAIGLAIAADEPAGYSLVDRFSRNFGVFREADGGRAVAFDPIFTREAALPRPGAARHAHRRTYRAAHNVGHYRFVECSDVDGTGQPRGDITPIGEVRFAFDPSLRPRAAAELGAVAVERTGDGPLVQEEYEIDASGIVHVVIRDLDSGYAREFELGGAA